MFYEAVYQPAETKGLTSEAKKFIGKRIALQEGRRLEDGPYQGQYCYVPSFNSGWIPECDLKEMKSISFVQWKQIRKRLDKK
jgi:hypothetical protein